MLRRLIADERLFSRGDPPSGLFAVLEGGVTIGAITETGKATLLTVCEPPSWFGEVAVFDGAPRTHDAAAERPSLLLNLPQTALDEILGREPRYWRDLGRLLAVKLRLLFSAFEDLSAYPVAVRLARRLLWMAHGYGERREHTQRVVEARQEQLAAMLATSRQTANQLLKDLEAKGVLRLSYGQIEILDLEALRRAAQMDQ